MIIGEESECVEVRFMTVIIPFSLLLNVHIGILGRYNIHVEL